MKTITATFEVVTPMFLGGADQSPEGIRPASVKGALRFWWRAWAWNAIRAQASDELSALQELHREEARLFGLAAKEGAHGHSIGGQGQFMLHVRHNPVVPTSDPFGSGFGPGILYLLGQGLGSFKGGNHCTRNALKAAPGGDAPAFEIKLLLRPQTSVADEYAITTALKLFGLLGALGSRARHGLGSVGMLSLLADGQAPWHAPKDLATYRQALQTLLPSTLGKELPPLSALSALSRIDISAQRKNANDLLDAIGREQQAYRSFGRNGLVNGQKAESNFKPDHDLLYTATQGNAVSKTPERMVFGLPHNYFFSSTSEKADVNYKPDSGEGRRASPLLLHIHRVGEDFVAVHTLLKSQFLPGNPAQAATVEIKSRKISRVLAPDTAIQWDVLHRYLDRFKSRETIHG